MSATTLNTNYRIPDKTLAELLGTIESTGFNPAFEIARNRTIQRLNETSDPIMIIEYLSWSHRLLEKARECTSVEKDGFLVASKFYRKLSHHGYWHSRKMGIIDYNSAFIQEAC